MKYTLIPLLTAALLACSDSKKTEAGGQADSTTVSYEQVAAESSAIINQLTNAAVEINRQTPMQIDAGTRLDSAHAASTTELQYFYTLTSVDRASVDAAKLEATTKPVLVQSIKTNPAMAELRDHSITMTYLYRDRSGQQVMRIEVGPAEYGK